MSEGVGRIPFTVHTSNHTSSQAMVEMVVQHFIERNTSLLVHHQVAMVVAEVMSIYFRPLI